MTNGGVIGPKNNTSETTASGVWSLSEQYLKEKNGLWPKRKITTEGLILWLDAANSSSYPGSGTTWFDISGNNRHYTISDLSKVSWDSDNEGSFVFDGNGGYMEDADAPNYLNGLTALTIDIWIKSDIIGTDKGFFHSQFPTNGRDENIILRYDNDGFSGGGDDVIKFSATAPINVSAETDSFVQTTNWQNITLTWNSTSGSPLLYVNGVSVNLLSTYSYTSATTGSTTALIGIASKDTPGTSGWLGKISHLTIYNRQLTNNEITNNFDAIRTRYGV